MSYHSKLAEMARLSKTIEYGKAGEHLVLFDLIMNGFTAYHAGVGLPYDIIVECPDKLLRVQVKSTLRPRTKKQEYLFQTKQRKKNKPLDFDLYAFVALDSQHIAYILSQHVYTTDIKFSSDIKTHPYIGNYPFFIMNDLRTVKEESGGSLCSSL